MTSEPYEIPLFPLNVVMFPGMTVPLHIFEARYRRMIGRCLEDETAFGIVYGTDEGFAEVGCATDVTALLERFPDGRMNILTKGVRRLRILGHFADASSLTPPDGQPLIVGLAEAFEDEEETVTPGLLQKVVQAYGEALRMVSGWAALGTIQGLAPEALSFAVAAQLGLPPEDKQAILEMRSVSARLERVLHVLDRSLPGIREMKRRTGGNGHFG